MKTYMNRRHFLERSAGIATATTLGAVLTPIAAYAHPVQSSLATAWAGWSPIPTGATSSGPTAVASGTKNLVFVRGTDNRIYQNTFNLVGTRWSGWVEVPGGGLTPIRPLSEPSCSSSTSLFEERITAFTTTALMEPA